MTVPNMLSIFRIVLIPVYAAIYFSDVKGGSVIAGCILVASGLTDLLDGYIARRFNQISKLGKVLDPLADKLTQVAVIVCLYIRYPILWALIAFLIFKELLMLSVGYWVMKKGYVVTSKWFGKLTTFLIYCGVAAFTFFPQLEGAPMAIIATVLLFMLAYSLFGYSSLIITVIAEAEFNGTAIADAAQAVYTDDRK